MNKVNLEYENYKRLREEYFRKKGITDPRKKKKEKEKKKTISELKAELREKKMPTGGTKADLIARLKRAEKVDKFNSKSKKLPLPKKPSPKKSKSVNNLYIKKTIFCPLCKGSVVKRHKGLLSHF